MVTFYLVRHGETLLNARNRAQGWTDSPLTRTGEETAAELGRRLKETAFDAAYTSDMRRAVQTAGLILAQQENPPAVQTDARLREWCLGALEAEHNQSMLQKIAGWLGGSPSFAELNRRLPEVAQAIYEHDTTGMAEPFSAIADRLSGALGAIAHSVEQSGGGRVLLVTHAFAMKTLLYLFARERLYKMDKVRNAEIFRLRYDGGRYTFEPGAG